MCSLKQNKKEGFLDNRSSLHLDATELTKELQGKSGALVPDVSGDDVALDRQDPPRNVFFGCHPGYQGGSFLLL